MFGILARLLEFLYSFWPSYGGSIILFTVIIMLVLAPLTFKSTRSMLAMQALQPEMKKLQNRYKDDRQKLNEEMMKFYQENKISPLGGCLPMLIQFPVFFILYAVLLGLTKRGPFGSDLGHSVACSIGGANSCVESVGTYANAGFFHPAYLKHTSDLYQSLSTTRVMDSFGLDLSQSAWSVFSQGLLHALPYVLMVLVVMGLTYLQQQQIQSRQPKKAEQNPTQQMMMKIMPIAMGFIYIIIPAGVVIYFLVSSVFRIGQQAMVTRTFYTGPNAIIVPTDEHDDAEGPVKKGFWEQFRPSEGALPQVGKKAKAERERSFDVAGRSGGSPKSSGSKGTKGGKSKANAAGRGSSGNTRKQSSNGSGGGKSGGPKSGGGRSGAKSSGKPSGKTSGKSTGKTSNKSSGKSSPKGSGSKERPSTAGGSTRQKRVASDTGGDTGAGRDTKDRTAPSRKAPSRKAPSRKAPEGPSRSDKSGQ